MNPPIASLPKALVLDGNQRSALATTRSLGRQGIEVVVADARDSTLAGASRHCRERFHYPAPESDGEAFLATVAGEARRRGVGVVLPMTELSTRLVLEGRDRRDGTLDGIAVPFAPAGAFARLSDKWRLCELARDCGVVAPRTWLLEVPAQLESLAGELEFPLVVKPRQSRTWVGGEWRSAPVSCVASLPELRGLLAAEPLYGQVPLLLQDYVAGEGRGLFALYDRGRPLVFFAHRRLREKPPAGGVSVLSESVAVDPRLQAAAERLLGAVAWHGVAMVEFKVAADGAPHLIEVNARFWGSLQLAIDAGVDFPHLLYRLAIGELVEAPPPYALGVRCRWLLGDLDRLYLLFKSGAKAAGGCRRLGAALWEFLRFRERRTRYEVNRWDDLRPFLVELRHYLGMGKGRTVVRPIGSEPHIVPERHT